MNVADQQATLARSMKIVMITIFLFYSILVFAISESTFDISNVNGIVIISVCIFFLVTSFALTSQKRYWSLLPIIGLSVPNAANKLFPSVPMGVSEIYEIPDFSYVTHIDIFLILGLMRFGKAAPTNKLNLYLITVSSVLLISYLVSSALSPYPEVALMGGYQIRYFIFLVLLFTFCRPLNYLKELHFGIIIGVMLLITESILFTILVAKGDRLTSGNFGVNTFGHILSAIAAYLVFSNENKIKKIILLAVIVAACIASGTRFFIVSLATSVMATYFFTSGKITKKVLMMIAAPIAALIILLMTPQGQSIVLGLTSALGSSVSFENVARTDDSSSIITRLILWSGTVNIITDYPLFGVGPAVWSYLKSRYEIPFDGVLDPHNDILNIMVSYGMPAALLFVYTIYIKPFHISVKNLANKNTPEIKCFFAFNFSIVISGISNAALWKHQVTLLFVFSGLALMGLSAASNLRPSRK